MHTCVGPDISRTNSLEGICAKNSNSPDFVVYGLEPRGPACSPVLDLNKTARCAPKDYFRHVDILDYVTRKYSYLEVTYFQIWNCSEKIVTQYGPADNKPLSKNLRLNCR